MAGVLGIPGVINNFNLYYKGTALVGLTGEITLLEIPFRILDEDAFSLMSPTETLDLTLRASEQYTVKSTGGIDTKGMRVVVRGRQKKLTGGTIKQGGAMDASVTVEVAYIMIELDGKKRVELDKLNNVYKVNDRDLLAKIRSQC